MQMRPLRSHRLTLLAAGALLASPLLGGCGFDYQTDRVNTISAGINDRDGSVDVLGAVVIAGEDDLGLFAATLVNNDTAEPVTLEGLQPNEQLAPADDAEPVEVPADGRVSLFETGGIEVSGAFGAGDFVDVTLSFSNGQTTSISIPVVTPCRQYSPEKLTGLTLPSSSPSAETSEAPTETATESAEATEGTEESTEESTGAHSEDGTTDRYSCDAAAPVEHGAEESE